jgi:ATP-binding cassette subfamily F protein uup
MDGEGLVKEYIGGYDDWYQQALLKESTVDEKITQLLPKKMEKSTQINKKLNFIKRKQVEQELIEIPDKIDILEKEYQEIIQKMASSEFYNKQELEITSTVNRMKWLEEEIPKIYQRWQELEHLLSEKE